MMPPGKRTARVQRTRGQLVVIESTVAVYPLEDRGSRYPQPCRRVPPAGSTRWGNPGDPAAFYLIVVGDHRPRPRGRRRCKTGSCPRIPSRAGQPIAIIEAAGGRLSGTGPSRRLARRAEFISGKTTVIVRWRSRDEAEDHAVPHGRTGDGLLHADRLRHAVRDHPRLSRMPPVATDDKLRAVYPGAGTRGPIPLHGSGWCRPCLRHHCAARLGSCDAYRAAIGPSSSGRWPRSTPTWRSTSSTRTPTTPARRPRPSRGEPARRRGQDVAPNPTSAMKEGHHGP